MTIASSPCLPRLECAPVVTLSRCICALAAVSTRTRVVGGAVPLFVFSWRRGQTLYVELSEKGVQTDMR